MTPPYKPLQARSRWRRGSVLVFLLAVIGCSGPERASVKIHAIAATGDAFYRPPQPIWRFAITNTGDKIMLWHASVEVKGEHRVYSNAGGHIDWPEGVLQPKQCVFTNMIVPASNNAWRASVGFWPVSSEDLKKAQADADRFGTPVTDFCPHPAATFSTYNGEWH